MKKSLIALAALAAVSGAAQAQSSVSVYGIIDSGYLSTQSDGVRVASNAQVANNTEAKGISSSASASSRLGFRGVEDLGGGLKAEFVIETGVNATSSTISAFNNRQSFVGVNGGFGGLRVGTQYTQHHTLAAALSPSVGVNMAGDLNYTAAGLTTSGAISNLGIVTTHAALTTLSTSATVVEADQTAAFLAANNALIAAGLSSSTVLASGAAGATNDAPTQGVLLVKDAFAAATSGVAAEIGGANKAIARAQSLLNADASAKLNTRLALANMDGYTVRNNNTVMYTSPVMSGVQATVQYNAPTTSKIEGGNEVKSTGQNFGLTYNQGKLMVGAAYGTSENETTTVRAAVSANTNNSSLVSLNTITAQATDINPVSATTMVNQVTAAVTERTTVVKVKNQETLAGASYDFGFAKLGYTYSAKKAKDTTSDLIDRKSHSVNATVPLSAKVTAWANYADGDQKIAVTNEYDLKAMQVGARYAFSKRTDAYAIYGQNKFDNKAAGAIDTKVTQYAFGLRHSF
jgi:predicted porin